MSGNDCKTSRPLNVEKYVVVSVYPWFKFYFPLFQTSASQNIMYNEIETKDEILTQHYYIYIEDNTWPIAGIKNFPYRVLI